LVAVVVVLVAVLPPPPARRFPRPGARFFLLCQGRLRRRLLRTHPRLHQVVS
jgi:hypothetical protein